MDFLNKTFYSFLINIVSLMVGLANTIILARLLSVEEFGVYGVVMSLLATISTSVVMGMPASNVYFIKNSTGNLPVVFSNTLFHFLLFSFLVLAIYFLFKTNIQTHWPEFSVMDSFVMLSIFPLIFFVTLAPSLLRGSNYIYAFNNIKIIISLAKLFGFIVFIYFLEKTYDGALWAIIFSHVLAAMYILYALRSYFIKNSYNWTIYKNSLNYGLKSHVGEILWVVRETAIIILITKYLGFESSAYFILAKNFASLFYLPVRSMITPLFPKTVGLTYDEKILVGLKAFKFSLIIFILVIPILYFLLPYIFPFLYGENYASANDLVQVFILGVVAGALMELTSMNVLSIGMPILRTYVYFIVSLITIVTTYFALETGAGILTIGWIILMSNAMAMIILLMLYVSCVKIVSISDYFKLSMSDFSEMYFKLASYKQYLTMKLKRI